MAHKYNTQLKHIIIFTRLIIAVLLLEADGKGSNPYPVPVPVTILLLSSSLDTFIND